jgi:hypothetical protein
VGRLAGFNTGWLGRDLGSGENILDFAKGKQGPMFSLPLFLVGYETRKLILVQDD